MSRVRVIQTAQIGAEPVSLSDIKTHLRLNDDTSEDGLLTALIMTARMQAEEITHRAIVKKTFKASLDGSFGGDIPWWDGVREGALSCFQSDKIELPYPPCISIDSVSLFSDEDVATLADPSLYYVEHSSKDLPQRLILRRGAVWPVALRVANGMEIMYTAGYNDGEVPAPLVTAIKMLVAHLYQSRGDMSDTANTSSFSGAAPLLAMYTIMRVSA